MKLKSPMQHVFSQIPSVNIQRSSFNRSHGLKTAFDAGWLIPIYADEALPGDTFNLKMTSFARLATPIKPIMDNLYLDTFFFAVPIRLIWDNWQKFNGEKVNPGDTDEYITPIMTPPNGGYSVESLSDYLGIPLNAEVNVCSFWHRAYNLIYNEWFRDQNLIDSVVVDKDNGPDTDTDYVLLKRTKRHDYFTSCLPWPQKGDSVLLPLGDSAPVTGIAKNTNTWGFGAANGLYETGQSAPVNYASGAAINPAGGNTAWSVMEDPDNAGYPAIYADLSEATASTINALRQAFQVQRMLERDSRGGSRYIEILRSHFGVISPDARLQRPEYLGGGSTPINVTPVPQTSESGATTKQGNLAAYGTASGQNGFIKSFTEHCVILGLANVRADLTYQQGLDRMFSRRTRYDFYWPSLSNIGEQAVLVKELYCKGAGVDTNADGIDDDDEVFGYQERYAEYRYKPSKITGKLRSGIAGTLEIWHLAQEFANKPTLGQAFIEENVPLDRVIAVPTEPHILFDSYVDLKCVRPMPVYSVPGMIDHL